MSDHALEIHEVELQRAPGYDRDRIPVDGLSDGINIVHGPNASGKTTLARAMQWLLWPEEAHRRTELAGRLELDGDDWRVRLDRDHVEYQRNGQSADRPPLPSPDQRDRYHLALHDLLQHETKNESFAEFIERESAGGYDLDAAYEMLGFDDSPSTRRLKVVSEVEDAIETWRERQGEEHDLKRKQDRLSTLTRKLEEAREARSQVQLLDQAIEYAEARNELERANAELEAFPDEVQDLDGDEAETVADLTENLETFDRLLDDAKAQKEDAEATLEETELPEGGVPEEFFEAVRELASTLESLERDYGDTEREYEKAKQKQNNARKDIPLDLETEVITGFDSEAWENIADFVREAQRVEANRELQHATKSWLQGADVPSSDLSELESGKQALEQWLATRDPDSGSEEDSAVMTIALVSAAVLTALSLILAVLVNPVFLIFLAVAVGLVWYARRSQSSERSDEKPRKAFETTFKQLDLEPPSTWSEEAVRERVDDISEAIAAHRLERQREERLDALSDQYNKLEQAKADLEQRRQELQDALGAAYDATDLELAATVTAISRWQTANDRVVGHHRELETLADQIETKRAKLERMLSTYGYNSIDGHADATGAISELETRADEHREALRELDEADEEIEDTVENIEEAKAERAGIYDSVGLGPDESDRLQDLCDQVEDYEATHQRASEQKRIVDRERSQLEELPGFEADLLETPLDELRRRKQEAERQAEEETRLQQEVTEIETEIETAKGKDKVERALAEKGRALDGLEEQYQSDCEAVVGDVLIDHLRDVTGETERPKVFERAQYILTQITGGRYELVLDGEANTFRARDTVKDRGFALDELSSGTRLQVLLSVRIAFVEDREQGVQLPLFLDETLANSDDRKAGVIIDSMIELARDGRQIFYFTAQGDEVGKWLTALDDEPEVDHRVIDLTEISDVDGSVTVPEFERPTIGGPSPPHPDEHDHESYGNVIDVPSVDPREGADAVHLWYLTDDLNQLHRFLELGIEFWGEIERLLERGSGGLLPEDPSVRQLLEQNGRAIEAYVEAWQRGRGDRVTRDVLEASGAVSENFIDDVTQLARNVGGDGRRIIDGLEAGEVDRFRSGKREELENYFLEHGYIDPSEPLDDGELRIRVINALVDEGVPDDEAAQRADRLLSRIH